MELAEEIDMTQTLTLILVFLLVFDRVIHYAVTFNKKKALAAWKSVWKSISYWVCFWKPLRGWVWRKIPDLSRETWREIHRTVFDKIIDTPEKSEIFRYSLPWIYREDSWTPEDIEIKEKQEKLNIQITAEERKLFIQHVIKIKPWTKLLFKTKFLT